MSKFHLYTAQQQPATRYRDEGFVMRNKPGRLLRTSCCNRRRPAKLPQWGMDDRERDALIMLFEDETDRCGFDARFAVPLDAQLKPYDCIKSSSDGEYDWCSRCGPIHTDDFHARCRVCPRAKRGKCELKNEHPAEFEDEKR